jgi:AcrR family transcriptional regulator
VDRPRQRLRGGAAALSPEGLDGASIDELIKEAGRTRGAFSAHFESKDALATVRGDVDDGSTLLAAVLTVGGGLLSGAVNDYALADRIAAVCLARVAELIEARASREIDRTAADFPLAPRGRLRSVPPFGRRSLDSQIS